MAKATLHLQDPTDPDSAYLLETLLERALPARGGGAAFAWATVEGIELFLRDSVFERLVKSYPFDLVVGVDSVTGVAALKALGNAMASFPKLRVRVFYDAGAHAIFHPKYAWFEEAGGGGSLVVGSGNLTSGGLRGNWEAYTLNHLGKEEVAQLRTQWTAWLTEADESLFPVDDAAIVARAKKNEGWLKGLQKAGSSKSKGSKGIAKRGGTPRVGTAPSGSVAAPESVLIAEVPKSGDRQKQVNFKKADYEEYFGAKVGTQRRMLFQWVKAPQKLGAIESRPSVESQSRNWRFELEAADGLVYPSNGRPIGVFLRVRPRSFLYAIVLPGEAGHKGLDDFLTEHYSGPGNQLRRVRTDTAASGRLSAVKRLVEAAPRAFADSASALGA